MIRGDTTSGRHSWGYWLSPLLFFFAAWVNAEAASLEQPAASSGAGTDQRLTDPPLHDPEDVSATTGAEAEIDQHLEYPPYRGPKYVIAVPPFNSRVGNVGKYVGKHLAEILVAQLIKSNRFVVAEPEPTRDIGKDQVVKMPGELPEGAPSRSAKPPSTQYTIEGTITEYHVLSGRGFMLGLGQGAVGTKKRTAYVGVGVLIVDKVSGEVYAAYNTTTQASSSGVKVKVGKHRVDVSHEFADYSGDLNSEESVTYSKSLRQATEDAVQQLIEFIITQSQQIPWQGSVIGADTENIYMDRGANVNIRVGDRLAVYSKGEPLIDKATGINLGPQEERLCSATVETVEQTFSIAIPESDCREKATKHGAIVRLN